MRKYVRRVVIIALVLGTFANFIHFNMPHGADYLDPELTPEESWDVAAYVLSQPRPKKPSLAEDFAANLLLKPVHPALDRLARLGLDDGRHRRGGKQDQANDVYAHDNPRILDLVKPTDI